MGSPCRIISTLRVSGSSVHVVTRRTKARKVKLEIGRPSTYHFNGIVSNSPLCRQGERGVAPPAQHAAPPAQRAKMKRWCTAPCAARGHGAWRPRRTAPAPPAQHAAPPALQSGTGGWSQSNFYENVKSQWMISAELNSFMALRIIY